MSSPQLDKTYDPKQVEDRWYRRWETDRLFHVESDAPGEPYTIVIPPPNVTGSLHIGHALNSTLQDILIRWRRMQGRKALWVPGTDHAGIATQNVVERQLLAEGTTRDKLGRQAFIERVWQWKAQSGDTILQQLKRLGASCDWDRLRFTMDDGLSKAVREVFVRLFEDGLIYRGERLINWCPRCLTALSDIEVEHEDTKGTLYHLRYPLDDDPSRALIVATTRPETMLADTAVAVHPDDPRYAGLIGKHVRLPLTDRTIPIVADPILVDRDFGTGVVKITPAHDFRDEEAGTRHHLPRLAILDQHANLAADTLAAARVHGPIRERLSGLSVAKARTVVEGLLRDVGALEKTEPHPMAIGKCYRCKTVVEPYLSPQWFVRIKPLAEPAIAAVEEGRIRLTPEAWVNNYLGWMRDIKDWCISRQIWWGHQIPAWYCRSCNHETLISRGQDGGWVIGIHAKPIVSRTAPSHCADCGMHDFIRDPDVLDTWFSSALWPFSTLGWPDQTRDLQVFYPTSTLVTGLDILFFWVARMIMMGLKFMGDVPFRAVYIHALVRDAEGQKMSKSKGNVIDPLGVMDTYGTDALRFTLASMASPGRDIKLAQERIEGYRNFANKIWNATRFVLMHLEGPIQHVEVERRGLADRWILSRMNGTIDRVTRSLEEFRFDHAAAALYQFIWHEYCDWYLEMVKPALQQETNEAPAVRRTLIESLETIQRLLHPVMPFITEEIWQILPVSPRPASSIMRAPYPMPKPEWHAPDVEADFVILERFVTTARNARALLDYQPAASVILYGDADNEADRARLARVRPFIDSLARGRIELSPISQWSTGRVLRLTIERLTVGMAVESDVDVGKALARVAKQRQDVAAERKRVEGKLNNAEFVRNAPPDVVAEYRERLSTAEHEERMLASSTDQLQRMTA